MKKSIILLIGAMCLALTGCGKQGHKHCEEAAPVRYEFGLPIDSFRIDTGFIQAGETLGGILSRAGANSRQLAGLNTIPRSEFDVRTVRQGNEYFSLHQTDTAGVERLMYWIYLQDIRRAIVLHLTDSIHVEKQEKPLEVVPRRAEAVIESSLWNAMVGNDLPIELALELSEIYAWTIDFFGLQKGDSIRVYYDEQKVDGKRVGIGRIYAAHFYHARKWQNAYYFEHGDIHSYFNENGESLKKAFLKAPLNYKRISSHFTYARKHPIFKTVRPHTGVDYAAPMGTPVVSIGDGVVIEKGYKGGGGNTVKIRHNSTYTTAYLHLSKYGQGIAVGSHVNQGQVIGYVGSTGNSTGPHLDFRIWKNGTPIDPLKMVSPPVEPVPANLRPEFDSIVTEYAARLLNQPLIDR